MSNNEALFARAQVVTPGGVSSPVRAFRSVGGTPYFVDRAEGAYVWDVDGRRYIDYVQSYGASILGHAHPQVVDAVRAAAGRGTTYGAPTENEVRLAEAVVARVPGCEQVRLVSTGTEAGMTAIRLARGYTGRDRVVKFAGCYHGHSDMLLAEGGSGIASLGLPDSAGVPKAAVADTLVAPYNLVPDLDERIAAVIVEPVAANMGLVAPAPDFLSGLRRACDAAGALLIFDEVITGFRVARGGASARFGVTPDLWCFGKVLGGGMPLAAVGGRRQVMSHLAPEGPVYQAGTLSGNPLATAAGLVVLELMDDEAYSRLEGAAISLATALSHALESAGAAATIPRVGTLVGVFLDQAPVTNYDQARTANAAGLYAPFFHGLLDRGVAFAPGAYEALFPSLAHTEEDIALTAVAVADAAAALAEQGGAP